MMKKKKKRKVKMIKKIKKVLRNYGGLEDKNLNLYLNQFIICFFIKKLYNICLNFILKFKIYFIQLLRF
jgi:hypothetical protein